MFKQIQLFGRPFFYTLQKCLWGLRPDFRVKALNKTLGMHALTAIAKQTDLCVYVCSFLYSQNEAGTLLVVGNNFHPKCDNHSFKLPQTWHRTYSGPWQYTHKVLSARKWKVLAIGEEQAYSFHLFCLTKKMSLSNFGPICRTVKELPS